jgi:hypothetical protein
VDIGNGCEREVILQVMVVARRTSVMVDGGSRLVEVGVVGRWNTGGGGGWW